MYEKVWAVWRGLVSSLEGCFQDDDRLYALLYFKGTNFEEGVSVSSLNCKLSGLAFKFVQWSVFSDLTKHILVYKAMSGYWRGRRVLDLRRPVSFAILGRILEQLPIICSSSYEVGLFKTAFVLAFFSGLRIGKLVSASKHDVGGLTFDDVLVWGDKVHLRIRRSKTDQLGQGVQVELGVVTNSPACPMSVVWEWLN